MSLGRTLDHALDGRDADAPGPVIARDGDRSVQVDVVQADKLGVRVREIQVDRGQDFDAVEVGRTWPRTLRELPDRVVPVEVDPVLGGATLRSDPDEMRDDRFMEVEVRGAQATVRRLQKRDGGGREAVDWTLTREQLERLVDTLGSG